jgi:hypothetical protein
MGYNFDYEELIFDSLVKETADAVLLDFGGKQIWLAKKHIRSLEDFFDHDLLELPMWLIEENSLECFIDE